MNNDRYVFDKISEIITYGFLSEGSKGLIKKRVQFQLIRENPLKLFSIVFGDLIDDSGAINSSIISNNGDKEKILMTVTNIIIAFHDQMGASTFIVGATESRTRLYQMWISRFFNQFAKDFLVLGYVKKHWQPFKKGVNYESFLIKRK